MIYEKLFCPSCDKPLIHRVISNTRYCNNENCDRYGGTPPIHISRNYADAIIDARHSLNTGWDWADYQKPCPVCGLMLDPENIDWHLAYIHKDGDAAATVAERYQEYKKQGG